MTKNNVTIPKGWRKEKIGSIGEVVSGATPKTSETRYWDGTLMWVTPKDMSRMKTRFISSSERKITAEGLKSCSAVIIPKNSLIMSSRAPIGYLAINTAESATNQGCKSIIPKDNVDTEYLYYYLDQNIADIKKLGSGSTFPEIGRSAFESVEVLVPPFSEQKKIAEILTTVDDEIQKMDEIIATTEKLKNGLMRDLFTKGIGNTKFKKTEIGEVPEGWKIKTFEEFATLQRGFDLPVQNRTFGQYALVTSNGITDTHEEAKVKSPGVVTGRSGTLGNVFYIERDFWPLNTTLYIKDFHNNNEKFVYYKIKSFDLARFGTGTGVPTLNRNIVHKELVAVPDYAEQKKIAEILFSVDEKISVNKKLKEKLTALKKGLMSDLLSGRVGTTPE